MTRRALWLALALAGCHAGKTGKERAETHVRELFATGFAVHVPVTSVECPADASETPGARFDCQVTFPGGLADTAHVDIRPDGGAHMKLERDIALGPELAAHIAQGLEASEGRKYGLNCLAEVVLAEGTVCKVTDDGTPVGSVRVVQSGGQSYSVPADAIGAARTVRRNLEQGVGPVEAVTCSPGGEIRPGVLTCDVRLASGARTTARYTISADDPKSALTVAYDPEVVSLEGLADDIVADKAHTTENGLTVDCGKGSVIEPAEGIVCSYVADGKPGRLRARHADGKVTLEQVL